MTKRFASRHIRQIISDGRWHNVNRYADSVSCKVQIFVRSENAVLVLSSNVRSTMRCDSICGAQTCKRSHSSFRLVENPRILTYKESLWNVKELATAQKSRCQS